MASDTQFKQKQSMDAMYRFTRHVYDASRKYYLLGRDRLIESLAAKPGERVVEVGCGTARNLIKMAQRYPGAHFSGIDISDEMLKTARANIERSGAQVEVTQGYAQNFIPEHAPNKIVFSYALSIIPPWKDSIDHALNLLSSGGELHIVDFGGMEHLPAPIRAILFWWLRLFHVYHKPEVLDYLKSLQMDRKGTIQIQTLYKGYSYIAVFKKA